MDSSTHRQSGCSSVYRIKKLPIDAAMQHQYGRYLIDRSKQQDKLGSPK
ncbi:MAG: hypothetical protein R3E08_05555 [Thiotrichaceae bacterium]